MHPGVIVGSFLGVLGGIIGAYASFRSASSPQERRYVIRCAIGFGVGSAAFLAGLLLLPPSYRWFLWIPYVIALPLSIMAANRGVARIRAAAAGGPG